MASIQFDCANGIAGLSGRTSVRRRVERFIAHIHALFLELGRDTGEIGPFCKLHPYTSRVAMKRGGMNQANAGHWEPLTMQPAKRQQLPMNSRFAIGKRNLRLF